MSLHQFANFNFIDGAYAGETFVEFLKDCSSKNVLRAGKYLIMDNAKIHYSRLVVEYLRENGLNVIFFPSYGPKLNLIEEGFCMIKANFHKIRPLSTNSEDIKKNVTQVLASINNRNGDFTNFFTPMRSFVDQGMNREPFN